MEHGSSFLLQGIVFLASAVMAVVISQRLGLGSVAGYLLAGIAIGPFGAGLVDKVEDVRHFAELGVVFLLFVIGLELEPKRLWQMRVRLLSLGASQVFGSIALIAGAAWLAGIDLRVGIVAGMALALSSTALALQPLNERGALSSQGGQGVFAILLFQDIAVIPMLTVLGIAWGFESAGLSMALGTFLAGVLLAESEYRHEIEAAVEPFKGLLLGLFFIAVGMSVDFGVLMSRPMLIAGLVIGLFVLKGVVLWIIARAAKLPLSETPLFILLLAQGGEFAFVLLTLGIQREVLPLEAAQAITLAVAISMLLTPFLLVLHDRVLLPRLATKAPERPADAPAAGKVIVAGLGRVGQVVARLLNGAGYLPTILDDDPDHVEQSRRFGFRVFYGDATRLDLLEAAGAAHADFLIITLDDPVATTQLARTAVKHFPDLRIIARARDMRHMFELRDIGVEIIERETFQSALELGRAALAAVGADAERAKRAVQKFAEHDKVVISKLYAAHKSEPDSHISISNELRDQFAKTLKEDEAAGEPKPAPTPGKPA
jgi:glutathione-regulated potassium-efflux system ancillary protein KefC